MNNMNEKINEMFKECLTFLDDWALIAIHNNFVANGGYGEEIMENTEENLNQLFGSPYEALNAIDYYSTGDEWMWLDDCGNLNSTSDESDLPIADEDEMAEFYHNNPSYLKDFKDFDEWYDAVENGLEEDDEEDEDEE